MSRAVLLTGASGFIGSAVFDLMSLSARHSVVVAARDMWLAGGDGPAQSDCLVGAPDCSRLLAGIDVIIHCAGRTYVMDDLAECALADYREVNVKGTLNLARRAAVAGVKRFIFISSIKVNGEGTDVGHVYRADDIPKPVGPFGFSKKEAEQGLRALAAETGMEVVIIRPVLVYGAGVTANFLAMVRWLDRGVPLPFAAINNRRSLVSLENLVSLIMLTVDHPQAANETFLVSDGEDLSTAQLLRRMADALGKPAHLFPVSTGVLRWVANVLGKRSFAQRLCGSLQVDLEKTQKLLGWVPPTSVDCGLRAVARYYQEEKRK